MPEGMGEGGDWDSMLEHEQQMVVKEVRGVEDEEKRVEGEGCSC